MTKRSNIPTAMDGVPLRFMENTINLLDRSVSPDPIKSICPFTSISRWVVVAKRKVDVLGFHLWNDEVSRSTRFAVVQNGFMVPWDAVYKTRTRVTRVAYIQILPYQTLDDFEELNAANLERIRSILARSISPIELNVFDPLSFSEELLVKMVSSLPRINQVLCDHTSARFATMALKHALSRGPIYYFRREDEIEVTEELLRLLDQMASSPQFGLLYLNVAPTSPFSAFTCLRLILDRLAQNGILRYVTVWARLAQIMKFKKRAELMGLELDYIIDDNHLSEGTTLLVLHYRINEVEGAAH